MRFGFKQLLVGEKRSVTTLITAAKETPHLCNVYPVFLFLFRVLTFDINKEFQ